jgi:hypothetical protein
VRGDVRQLWVTVSELRDSRRECASSKITAAENVAAWRRENEVVTRLPCALSFQLCG